MTNRSEKRIPGSAPRKPSGISGEFEVVRTVAGFTTRHKIIEWPAKKEEVEQKIFEFFKREFEKAGATFLNAKRGGTGGDSSEGFVEDGDDAVLFGDCGWN